jgi:pteridine reductase
MDLGLAGKVALVTGSSRGVGRACAKSLLLEGARVMITARNPERLEATRQALQQETGGEVRCVAGDLGRDADAKAVVEATLKAFGQLDVLVNNASTFYPTPVGEITSQAWDDLMGSNLKAPLFLSQAAAPELQKSRGLILNIVDIHGMRPLRNYTVYCAAKAGLHMLTRSLAKELGPNVRVNGISPGPVLWPEEGGDEQTRAKIIQRTILQRMGTPEDIARTALFFAASAPFITGQILAVDGGRSVAW